MTSWFYCTSCSDVLGQDVYLKDEMWVRLHTQSWLHKDCIANKNTKDRVSLFLKKVRRRPPAGRLGMGVTHWRS